MAATGLEFAANDYDRDRFRRVAAIAEGIAALAIDAAFTPERPYLADVGIASPKTGCTVAAFDETGKVVLIKRADNGRWALPGGYAEVGSTPATNALREFHEETGLDAAIERLIGVYDNREFASVSPYHFYTCLFRARIARGDPRPSPETTDVRLFDPSDAPIDMSAMQRAMLEDAVANGPLPVFQ